MRKLLAALAVIGLMSFEAMAADAVPSSSAAQATAGTSGVQATPGSSAFQVGLHWDHCQTTWRKPGDARTYCWFKTLGVWVWTTDSVAADQLTNAAASAHWVGINITNTAGAWDRIQLWDN